MARAGPSAVAVGLAAVLTAASNVRAAPPSHPAADLRDVPHAELGVFPALGYNPDTGLDLGVFVHRARFEPGARPYAWRARMQVQTSVLVDDGLHLPRQEHFLKLDLPRLPDRASRLRTEVVWERQLNAGYFGIGNASRATDPALWPARHYHEYRVESVRVEAGLEHELAGPEWRGFVGASLARYDIDAYSNSLLAAALEPSSGLSPPPPGTGLYTSLVLQVGLVLDRRDHETVPTRGLFHDLVARAAPALGAGPGYGGFTYTARFYLPLVGHRLVLATRAVGDVAVGDVPLVELNRVGGLLSAQAFGGADGLRGIPQGRFVGKTKALGSAEVRAALLPFRLFGIGMNLGAAAFTDVGRVWAGSLEPEPELDGDRLGLHCGFGAGPRLRWGDSLLVRLDLVYSPDGDALGQGPLATYLVADSKF